jgi:hypothetical protein
MSNPSHSASVEEGSVEAGLILIPLTALFLLIAQVIVAGSWQSLETSRFHDQVNRMVISHPGAGSSELRQALSESIQLSSLVIDELPQGRIITAVKAVKIPIVSRLLGNGASIRVVAVVHVE